MSYSIHISGHKETESTSESESFERDVLDKARAFVASLEGVTGASLYGGHIGSHDLKQPADTGERQA